MKSLSKTLVVAAGLFGLVVSTIGATTVFADSPGQLSGGADVYMVKNLTKGGAYANTVTADPCDELQYSIRLHNAAFGGLTNIQVSVNLPSGSTTSNVSTMTATPAEGAAAGTSDTATVNLSSAQSITYNGGATLYGVNGNVIKSLESPIGNGVNIGDMGGSTTQFVNFKAKVSCDTPVCPPGTTGTPPNCDKPKPPVTPPTSTTKTTPPAATVTPSVIPSTGPEAAFAGILGSGALGYGIRQWFNSRRSLRDLLQ